MIGKISSKKILSMQNKVGKGSGKNSTSKTNKSKSGMTKRK